MKILFDYSIFNHQRLGGISRYFINLDYEINKTINESKIVAPIHYNSFLKRYNKYEGKFTNKFPKFTRTIFRFYNNLVTKSVVSTFKPNIFHKTYYNNFWPKNFKGKKIMTVYDLIHEIYYKDFNFNSNYRPKKDLFSNVDTIIAISNNTKADLINFYDIPKDKISVTHLGINLQKIESYTNMIKEPYILFVGERIRYKNFSNLLISFANSGKINKNFKLVLFGGGNLFKEELDLIKDNNLDIKKIIQISGDDQTLASLYKFADLFVFPSKYEGFGLPLLEAASKSCPIACSDIKVFREIMGESVQYFDPNSTNSISTNLEKVLFSETLKKNLLQNAKKKLMNFSWSKCANETLKIYKN